MATAYSTSDRGRTSGRQYESIGRNRSARMRGNGSMGNGRMWGAVAAGVAIGLAANFGRKAMMQAMSGASGDWYDTLKAEHTMALKVLDKIEATSDDQTAKRMMLLTHLKNSLLKHMIEEEDVVYPALRDAAHKEEADHLNHDHGYMKTYLYELLNMPKDSPEWRTKVRELRSLIAEHAREEEEKIFPPFRNRLSKEENARLTTLVNKEGFSYA